MLWRRRPRQAAPQPTPHITWCEKPDWSEAHYYSDHQILRVTPRGAQLWVRRPNGEHILIDEFKFVARWPCG